MNAIWATVAHISRSWYPVYDVMNSWVALGNTAHRNARTWWADEMFQNDYAINRNGTNSNPKNVIGNIELTFIAYSTVLICHWYFWLKVRSLIRLRIHRWCNTGRKMVQQPRVQSVMWHVVMTMCVCQTRNKMASAHDAWQRVSEHDSEAAEGCD